MTNLAPSVLTQEVAAILRAARARHDVSQGVLAESIDVSQSQMSKILRGQRPITIDQLDILCELLDLGIVDVLREADSGTEVRAYMNPVVRKALGLNEQRAANGAPPIAHDELTVTAFSGSFKKGTAAARIDDVDVVVIGTGAVSSRKDLSSFEDADEAARKEDTETPRID